MISVGRPDSCSIPRCSIQHKRSNGLLPVYTTVLWLSHPAHVCLIKLITQWVQFLGLIASSLVFISSVPPHPILSEPRKAGDFHFVSEIAWMIDSQLVLPFAVASVRGLCAICLVSKWLVSRSCFPGIILFPYCTTHRTEVKRPCGFYLPAHSLILRACCTFGGWPSR